MTSTPLSQLLASQKYYKAHKQEINERRKEYLKQYNKQKTERIRQDDEQRLARNEYQRRYRLAQKHNMLNSIYIQKMMSQECLDFQVVEALVR